MVASNPCRQHHLQLGPDFIGALFYCSVANQIGGVALTSLTPSDPSLARAWSSTWVQRHTLARRCPPRRGRYYAFLLLSQDRWRYGYLGIIAEPL
jgi:hypothetical protein